MKICVICGKTFDSTDPRHICCSEKCRLERQRQNSREYKRLPKVKTLEQWQQEAAACGLSYGKYRAQVELLGKTFEELKS